MKNKTKIEYRVKRESDDSPVKIFVDIFDIEDKGLREYLEKSGLVKQNENYEVVSRSVFHPAPKQLENSTKNINTYNSKFKQDSYKQQAVQSMATRSHISNPPNQSHSFFENSQEEKQKFQSLSDYGLDKGESTLFMASLDSASFAPVSPRPTSINYQNTNMDKPFRVNLHSIPFFRDNNYPQYVDVMAPTKGKSWMIAMNRVGIRHFPDGWRGLEAFEGEKLADFGVYTKVNYSQVQDNNKDYNKI